MKKNIRMILVMSGLLLMGTNAWADYSVKNTVKGAAFEPNPHPTPGGACVILAKDKPTCQPNGYAVSDVSGFYTVQIIQGSAASNLTCGSIQFVDDFGKVGISFNNLSNDNDGAWDPSQKISPWALRDISLSIQCSTNGIKPTDHHRLNNDNPNKSNEELTR